LAGKGKMKDFFYVREKASAEIAEAVRKTKSTYRKPSINAS